MIALAPPFRLARADDAPVLAELVNDAGEGLPLYFWQTNAGPGEDPWAFGRERQAKRAEAGEIIVIEEDGRVVSAMTGYPIERAEPVDDVPELFRPLQELENEAVGTWYLNVLATVPEARGRGHGGRLVALAEAIARDAGLSGVSIIAAGGNAGSQRLYARLGYTEAGRRPVVKGSWTSDSDEWILLLKALP